MKNDFKVNFELYKIFYLTAKCGNITQAAQKLFLTQPSVSKHLAHLEQELGCKLFRRSKHGVALTAEGQVLMRKIETACDMIQSAENELAALHSLEEGTVSIVSTEMSFKSYVLPTMTSFMKRHPKVKIRFSNALNEDMISMLQNGAVDIIIMHEPFRKESFMDIHVIEQMSEHFVCSEAFKELSRQENSPETLLEYPCVSMPEGSSTMDYLRQYFSRFGLSFNADIELTTVELTAQAVESGLGIGILPEKLAAPKIASGALYGVPVKYPLPKREACLITNKKLPPTAAAQAFIAALFEEQHIK